MLFSDKEIDKKENYEIILFLKIEWEKEEEEEEE